MLTTCARILLTLLVAITLPHADQYWVWLVVR
jgi:hypothetical protein